MSENKPELFTRAVRKHAGRAKERILQNLGKADRTTDEVFDDYVHNFTRQQNQAVRLQREMTNYVRCARAMQTASKSLLDTVHDMYEPDWADRDQLATQMAALEQLWAQYCHKLADQLLEPVNTYTGQFPEIRRKIEKRGRKLVDYDSHRHAYEALQNTTKKRDQLKIDRQKEVMDEARRTFEAVNCELYDQLPAVYDSRIPFLVSNLQTLFTTDASFHADAAKIQTELETVTDRLQKEASTGKYTMRRNSPKSPKSPAAPVPASPTARDDRVLVRPSSGGGGGLKQTFSSITKRLSVRQDRPQPSRPRGVARAATFHVPYPSETNNTNPHNPFRQNSAGSPDRQPRQQRRHNPFLDATSTPPPPIPTSPPPVNGGDGEQILEVTPHRLSRPGSLTSAGDLVPSPVYPSGSDHSSGSPPPKPPRSPQLSGLGQARSPPPPAVPGPTRAVSLPNALSDPPVTAPEPPRPDPPRSPAKSDPESPIRVETDTHETRVEPAYSQPHKARDGPVRPDSPASQPASTRAEPPSSPGRAESPPAPLAQPETSTVVGVYPTLPSLLEVDSSSDPPGRESVRDPDATVDRGNKSGKEETRPYEEIPYKADAVNHSTKEMANEMPHVTRPVNGTSKPGPEETYDIPVGATTDNLPAGVLYRVKAAYKYQAEDTDELSFDVGEVMQVVEYDDPEEQEEGWLMGVKEATGQKGLFPANFTRPI